MGHKHSVRDMGAHFIIDQFSRAIKNDSANKTTVMQYDHKSERLTFEMPLLVDGHNMTLCDSIELHYINISTDGKETKPGTADITDIHADGDNAVFTWLITDNATQLAGSLNFLIIFKCIENGVTTYRWSTDIYKALPVSAGMDNGEAVLSEYPDILASWKSQLFGVGDTEEQNLLSVSAAQQAAIAAKGETVLATIPLEYAELSALAESNYCNKAGAIVPTEQGESIVVNDSSDYPLQGLKVFGKSTQDGTPSPDNPQEINSVENPAIMVAGKNLVKLKTGGVAVGVTETVSNGLASFSGTATSNGGRAAWKRSDDITLSPGTYNLSLIYDSGTAPTPCLTKTVGGTALVSAIGNFTVEETTVVYFGFNYIKDRTYDAKNVCVLLEVGEIGTEFEPYKEIQTVSLSHTLPGIPVSSGGNYTDENGQQWICDEVDLARGVYVQRVKEIVLDDTQYWWDYTGVSVEGNDTCFVVTLDDAANGFGLSFCTHFENKNFAWDYRYSGRYSDHKELPNKYFISNKATKDEFISWLLLQKESGTPVVLVYVLKTPIETDLSDAEINAFKALHSNKPVTTVLNNAGATMELSYVADTKAYIDNAIARLSAT